MVSASLLPCRGRSSPFAVGASLLLVILVAVLLLFGPWCSLLPQNKQDQWCRGTTPTFSRKSVAKTDVLVTTVGDGPPPQNDDGATEGLRGLRFEPKPRGTKSENASAEIKTPSFPQSEYQLLPDGCQCTLPDVPPGVPPGKRRHPQFRELLTRFMAEDPTNVLAPTDQRRVLFVGDSLVRYLGVSMANRAVEEGWFRTSRNRTCSPSTKTSHTARDNATPKSPSNPQVGLRDKKQWLPPNPTPAPTEQPCEDDRSLFMDPWMLKFFGTHESPMSHLKLGPEAMEQKPKVVTTRYEAEPYLTPARDWTASGSIGFRPTHVVLQRGPWDLVMVSPHSPRRSFVQYVEGLVKARRTFPVNVRVAVYGLHAIHFEDRTFDEPNDCGNRHETTIYRRMFYCAVRRANAILAETYAGSGLLEYYDSYAWSMGLNLNDTYRGDALHYVGRGMAKLTDGMLDLFLRPPEYPAPLKDAACTMNLDFIRADETPCQPHFDKMMKRKVLQTVDGAAGVKNLLNLSSTLPRRLMAAETPLGTPSLGSPENVTFATAVRAVEVGRCAGALLFVLRNIGRLPDALAPYSPLDGATKDTLRSCQRWLDTHLVEGSPVVDAYNSMVFIGRFPCVDASFIPLMQSILGRSGKNAYELPPKLVQYCYEDATAQDNIRHVVSKEGKPIFTTHPPTEPCLNFLDNVEALPGRSMTVPIDSAGTYPVPRNASLLKEAGLMAPATFGVAKHICLSHFARAPKEELLKLGDSKKCGALRQIARGVGQYIWQRQNMSIADIMRRVGCL